MSNSFTASTAKWMWGTIPICIGLVVPNSNPGTNTKWSWAKSKAPKSGRVPQNTITAIGRFTNFIYVQGFPDLYKNAWLIEHIPEEVKEKFHLPRSHRTDLLAEFKEMRQLFDALSFWIIVYGREQNRTFANITEANGIRRALTTLRQMPTAKGSSDLVEWLERASN